MVASTRVMFPRACAVAAWLAAACAGVSLAATPDVARLRPGIFLYASPALADPNFSQTVVLLVQYGPEGAMGLVINRPGDLDAKTALPALAGMPMYEGGPVQTETMIALVRTRRPSPKAVRVLDDVYLSGKREELEAAARGGRAQERVRVFSGYSGWTAGQLESEVKAGGWLVGPGDAAAVFSPEPGKLWRKVFLLLQRREAAQSSQSPSSISRSRRPIRFSTSARSPSVVVPTPSTTQEAAHDAKAAASSGSPLS